MKNLSLYYLFAVTFFISAHVSAQTEAEKSVLRKIDLNLSFNMVGKTNYSKEDPAEDRVAATSGQFTIYPLAYKKCQFGLGFGIESIKIGVGDTADFKEDRVPLMAVSKFNFTSANSIFIKTQLGTAVTFKSEYSRYGNAATANDRTDIGAPVLASISFGAVMPLDPFTVGLELGYAYKQTGYKYENRYNKGAVFLSVIGSFR